MNPSRLTLLPLSLSPDMVCSYKGLVFVITSYGTTLPTCWNYCEGCPTTLGQTVFIDKALKAFPSPWRVCSWHKNHHLYQIGQKYTEVGLPLYDVCRKHGAIITTGHEHSYSRTKRMSSFQEFTVSQDQDDTIVLREGYSLAWVSGIGGIPIRDADPSLEANAWWASTAAKVGTATSASYGAVICKFNLNGELRRALCETKLVDGRIIDSFYLASDLQSLEVMPENPSVEPYNVNVCGEGHDVEVQVSTADDNAVHTYEGDHVECAPTSAVLESGNRMAFRFNLVKVQPHVGRVEAHFEFVAAKERTGPFDFLIYAELPTGGHSSPFVCDPERASLDLPLRNRTIASVRWNSYIKWFEGGMYPFASCAALPLVPFSLTCPSPSPVTPRQIFPWCSMRCLTTPDGAMVTL